MPEGNRKVGAEVFVQATQARDELKKVQGDVRGIGTAAQEGSSKATAAMDGVASSSRGAAAAFGTQSAAATGAAKSIGELATQKAALLASIRNVEASIRGETKVLGDAQNAVKQYGTGQKALDTALADSQAKLAGYIQQHGMLKEELAGVTTQMRAATAVTEQKAAADETSKVSALEAARAEQALALANVEGAAAADLSGRQMIVTAGAASRVAGAAIPGARAIGVLAGAFSGMGFVQLAVIVGLGILIGELFKLGKAKEEQINLDQEQIALDEKSHQSLKTGTLFTAEYARVLHDRDALNVQLKRSVSELGAAQLQEAEHGRANVVVSREMAAATGDLQTKVGLYVYSLFASTKSETQATEARLEASKVINEQVNSRIKLAAETGKSKEALEAELKTVMGDTDAFKALTVAIEAGAFARAQLQAGRSEIEGAKANVAVEAAKKGIDLTRNHAEAMRLLTQELTRQGEEVFHNAQVTELAEKNLRAFTDGTKQAEAVAHRLAVTTSGLRKEFELYTASAEGDGKFSVAEEKLKATIDAKRRELALNKQLTQENAIELVAIEAAGIAKIKEDHIKAREEAARRIAAINDDAITNEYDRHFAMIEKQVAEDRKAFTSLGLEKNEIDQLTTEARKAREAEFTRWLHDEEVKRQKHYKQSMNEFGVISSKALAAEEAEMEESERRRTQIILKSARDQANARIVAGKFLLSQGQGASSHEIDQFLGQLKKLGPAFQDVDKNAEQAKTAIDYVRNAFGFASQSAEMFDLKLDLLTGHSITFGQIFNAIVSEMFTTVQGLTAIFDSIGQAVSSVFEGIITGTQSAKAAFLNFLATILMQMGQMAIAIGTIMLFLPGYGGLGVGLIAAGIAAMALAGVFRGLASNASQAHNAAIGGAASGSAATGSSSPAVRPQPQVIDLSSATRPRSDFSGGGLAGSNIAQSQRPLYVTLQLDRNVSNDLINGKRVLTRSNIKDEHFQAVAAVVKKVKK